MTGSQIKIWTGKKHFYFFSILNKKNYETFLEIIFDRNFSDHVQKSDWIFFISDYAFSNVI